MSTENRFFLFKAELIKVRIHVVLLCTNVSVLLENIEIPLNPECLINVFSFSFSSVEDDVCVFILK